MRDVYVAAALFTVLTVPLTAQAPARSGPTEAVAPPAVAATFIRLERGLAKAAVRRDTIALARMEPPNATFHYPDGTTGTGTSDVQGIASGAVTFDSIAVDSMHVRLLSPTVAIVTGRAGLRGRAKPPKGGQAQDLTGQYRFLDVWEKRGNRWQIAASQSTRINAP
jgi:hypothetical protein